MSIKKIPKINTELQINRKLQYCNQCAKLVSQVISSKKHMSTNTYEKIYNCNHCTTNFSHDSSFKEYIDLRNHTNVKKSTNRDLYVGKNTIIAVSVQKYSHKLAV